MAIMAKLAVIIIIIIIMILAQFSNVFQDDRRLFITIMIMIMIVIKATVNE